MSGSVTYNRKTVKINQVHTNIDQELIQITEDKLELILKEHIKFIENKNSWIAPFSLLVTLITVFSTTNFVQFYFSPDTWKAIFVVTFIIILGWFLKSIYVFFKAKAIDDLINKIKNNIK